MINGEIYEFDDIDEVKIPEVTIPDEIDALLDVSKYDSKIGTIIENFMQVMEENFNKEDLSNYYNNINNLKVKKRINLDLLLTLLLYHNAAGIYNVEKNEIRYMSSIKGNEQEAGIFHELFHMASCKDEKNKTYVGFCQLNKKTHKSIGTGINEGFTQYMTIKYYKNDLKGKTSYPYEIGAINILKALIGEEKMISLYLRSDLKGLIMELSKYASVDSIIDFITDLDFIVKYHYQEQPTEIRKEVRERKIKVNTFLAELYYNGNKDKLEAIGYENTEELKRFVDSFEGKSLNIPGKRGPAPADFSYYLHDEFLYKVLNEKGYNIKAPKYTVVNWVNGQQIDEEVDAIERVCKQL